MNAIFNYARRFDSPGKDIPLKDFVRKCETIDPSQALLDMIFAPDPVSGLPSGDLSVFLGDKANPEVKMFIQNQLMHENAESKSSVNIPDDVRNKFRSLSDDDVALFSRNFNESREEYADRLRLYFVKERADRAAKAKQKEYDDLVEKLKNGN